MAVNGLNNVFQLLNKGSGLRSEVQYHLHKEVGKYLSLITK